MKHKPAEKNTGLWLSIKSETTCKNSAHLDEKKKQTKIRHRMVMLEGLHLLVSQSVRDDNQSIDQSINQPTNQPTNQLIDWSIINLSVSQSMNQPINQLLE